MFFAKQVSIPASSTLDLMAAIGSGGEMVIEVLGTSTTYLSSDSGAVSADAVGPLTAARSLPVSDGDEVYLINIDSQAVKVSVVAYTV